MKTTTCAFAGHRLHKFPWKDNEADPRCMALKAVLMEQIAMLVEAGVSEYVTGGADGVDCWAAEIVLGLREKNPALKLRCVLPHEGQADRWSDSARERYYSILKRADSSGDPGNKSLYTAQKYPESQRPLLRRRSAGLIRFAPVFARCR